jgi:hypothetical protein
VKHLLMDPAFPAIIGEWAATASDPLGGRLDPDFFELPDDAESADNIAEAIILAAALQYIAETRVW